MCFGLHNDNNIQSGQIAHIDGNSANSAEDNLSFLCLRHHDELDTRTSQSKGLTALEVRHYRDELHKFISAMRSPNLTTPSPLQAVWEAWGGYKSITIQEIGAGVYRAHGIAIDGPRKEAPNLGTFDVLSKGFSRELIVRDEGIYIEINLVDDCLHVSDRSELGAFGIGVNFSGTYERSNLSVRTLESDI